MIRMMRAALRGIRAELSAGESGWVALSGDQVFTDFGQMSKAGTVVSSESAMRLSAVWACVTRSSQLIASLPMQVFEKRGDGNRVPVEDQLVDVLAVRPNSMQTAEEFWEGMVAQMLMRGNAYAEKMHIGQRLVGLRPLFSVTPKLRDDGTFEYRVGNRGRVETLPADKVFHLRGFGAGDGLGLSAVRYGVQSLGAALAADNTASSVFQNRLNPGSVMSYEGSLNPDQRSQLQTQLSQFAGSENAGKMLVLENGITWNKITMTPEDAQLLETRRFQVEDICRWFGIPPIVIGHSAEGQTMWGTGIENIMLSWLTTGINPLLRRMEARMRVDLMPSDKRRRWHVEFNREAMLQMDSRAKGDFLARMVAAGIMTSDESRDKLNLARRGGAADELRAQTATAPIDMLGKEK